MIVLVCTAFFIVSLLFGTSRGVLIRNWRRWRLNRNIDRQHVLRAIYELQEAAVSEPGTETTPVTLAELHRLRSWTMRRLKRALAAVRREELIEWSRDPVRLTRRGVLEAARITRQHRLWELYLIEHADVAPSRVDRDADAIEHVLEPEIVHELEVLLDRQRREVPRNPHCLTDAEPLNLDSRAETPSP